MKKLLSFFFSFSVFATSAQTLEGIDPEHLVITTQEDTSAKSTGFTTNRISLNTGVTLEYVEQGSPTGVPVIFLHGLADSWHSFATTLPYLPPSIHAFAITQRGHGNSEQPQQGYTPKHFAADVADFIKQKKIGPAIIIGHSMGGVNVQQFALDYPALAKAIVIIGSDVAFRNNPGVPEFYHEMMKLKGPLSREFMNEFQKGTVAKPIDSTYFQLLVDEGMKTPARVFKAALTGMINIDFTAVLKNIQCPALIVWGDQDAVCLRKGQDLMAAQIKHSKLLVYEGVGHALHWEEPKRFANDLLQFIVDELPDQHEVKK